MEGMRRTLPRSARRPPPKTVSPTPVTHDVTPRYTPSFNPLPALRSGQEALTSTPTPSYSHLASAVTCAHWLPGLGATATAAVGTGGGDGDFVHVYSVERSKRGFAVQQTEELRHGGRARCMGGVERIYVGSSDGSVRVLGKELKELYSMKRGIQCEAVVGVVALDDGFCCGGEDGTLVVASENGVKTEIRQVDSVGIRAMAGGEAGNGRDIIVAGGGGGVMIWDSRQLERRSASLTLMHPVRGSVCESVVVDAACAEYVLGGCRSGEVTVWDRRMAESPVNRLFLHDGMVWDLCVVSASKSGVLLSAGEDACVWLIDFAAAALRGGWSDAWAAQVAQSDLRNVAPKRGAVHCVASHKSADLFVYGTEGGSVAFGSLYS